MIGWLTIQEHGEGEEQEGEEEEEEGGDDFADMNREELSELWGVLRQLGWFSLLQDAFSTVMFANVLAYVRRRYVFVYVCDVFVLRLLVYLSAGEHFYRARLRTRRGVRRSSFVVCD